MVKTMTTDLNVQIKNDLIERAGELLVSKGIQDLNVGKPKYPTCVFYLGDKSASYMSEMNNDLTRGWGDAGTHVKHYKVCDANNMMESISNCEGISISLESLRHDVTELMMMQDVFADMNFISIYVIIETSNMSAEIFEKWYHFVEEIQSALRISLRTALIVIVNQSLDHIESSEKIREKLLDIYNSKETGGEKTHLYDTVFLFGNRLRNGSFINLNSSSKEYEDYNLFADLILLTNTNTTENAQQLDKLYNRNTPALSAAYSHLSKPVWDITMITLKRCLNKIKASLDTKNLANLDNKNIIEQILKLSNGSMPVIDEFYKTNIQPKVDKAIQALEFLPSQRRCLSMTYDLADDETQGCLSAFVQKNCVEITKSIIESNRPELITQIKASILASMTLQQQKSFFYYTANIGEEVENLFAINSKSDYSRVKVSDAVKNKTRKATIALFSPLVITALEEIREVSGASIDLFGKVYECVGKMNIGSNSALSDNIHEFYEDIVDLYYLDRARIENITKNIISKCRSNKDLFETLYKELSSVFSSNPIFSMSFVDELTERLKSKGDNLNIEALIAKELLQGTDNKLALHSYSVYPNHYFEAYFLNTDKKGNTPLVTILTKRGEELNIPVLCQNTLSNERIETIWFYRCSEDNIRA